MTTASLADAMTQEFLAAFFVLAEEQKILQAADGIEQDLAAIKPELDAVVDSGIDAEADAAIEVWNRFKGIEQRAKELKQQWQDNERQLSLVEQRLQAMATPSAEPRA